MAKQRKARGDAVALAELGLENYEVIEVNRAEIKGAPYNPRKITDAERRKLKAGLQRHGLVSPITWNKRTGHIVGGHQRIASLDALAGTKEYRLRVAAIDVDESREKELNVLLNNPEAQGDWDLLGLKSLFDDKTLSLEGMGFDRSDLFHIFGDDITIVREPEELDALAEKVREFSRNYDAIRAKNKSQSDDGYYLVVVFRDDADVQDFLTSAGLPMNRYQSGAEIRRLCGFSDKFTER